VVLAASEDRARADWGTLTDFAKTDLLVISNLGISRPINCAALTNRAVDSHVFK
jgi:hypothetical protein